MSKPHILCVSARNWQEKMNKPSKHVYQSTRLHVLFKSRDSGHKRTPGGNSTSYQLNPSYVFRTNMVSAYWVNLLKRFTSGALSFLTFCSIYFFYSTAHSALLKNPLAQAMRGRGQPCYAVARWADYSCECRNGMKEGNMSDNSLGLLACKCCEWAALASVREDLRETSLYFFICLKKKIN